MTELAEHRSAAPAAGTRQSRHTSIYTELSQRVRQQGLLRRRYGYYWTRIIGAVLAFAGIWAGVVVLGDSWWQLILAAALAVVVTQFGFLGHDSAHRQIFASARWNEWTSRVLSGVFAGLSYGWWMTKHNRHHAAPNQEGKDPDIASKALAFTPAAVDSRGPVGRWFAQRQGWLFFPMLLLEGLNLHFASISAVLRRGAMKHARTEGAMIAARLVGFVAVLLVVLPPGKAAAFAGVQMGLFGLFLGGAFAPNHKGMPIVPATMKIDFLRRQVLMSRNIRGGAVTDFAMGGLNYQIEHHLFPSMPRPNLKRVRPLVRAHCAKHQVKYTETSLLQSYGIVVRYLNQVGIRARDPFECPLVRQYRH